MGEVIVDGDGNSSDDSLSLSTPLVGIPALSFGNILKGFPDLLFCILPYIADRIIWNSIALSSKDLYEQTKAIPPPWPICYKLPSGDSDPIIAWSPCGTRIAYKVDNFSIVIVDQRSGPFCNNVNNSNHFGWLTYRRQGITDFKFSPDGNFLVSIGDDDYIRLWDNVTGNYEQLQEWNMAEEFGELMGEPKVSVSACSKYIVVSLGTCVFLKEVENGDKTIKSLMLRFATNMEILNTTTRFSSDGRAVFICSNFKHYDIAAIKVWRHYLDDDDEDCLITLWREVDSNRCVNVFEFSHDNTMVAIHDKMTNLGIVWSIDTDHKSLTKKFDFQGSQGLHFTPDDKYIVVNKENRPTLWSIAEGKYTKKTIHFFDNGSNYTKHDDLVVKSFSPNNRQCIVVQAGSGNRYITSYFVK